MHDTLYLISSVFQFSYPQNVCVLLLELKQTPETKKIGSIGKKLEATHIICERQKRLKQLHDIKFSSAIFI